MSTAQRVSRGFHRLAIFLATIPLVIGTILSLGVAVQQANEEEAYQQKVVCAGQHPERWPPTTAPKGSLTDEQVGIPLSLQQVGCSDKGDETVSYAEARNPPQFYWWASYASNATPYLIFAVVVSVLLYGLVRAIGWVIGGFAAS
jgi:hypothetical protein